MTHTTRLLLTAGAGLALASLAPAQLGLISHYQPANAGGAEILSFDPTTNLLALTYSVGSDAGEGEYAATSGGIEIASLGATGALTFQRSIDLMTVFGAGNTYSVSSVAMGAGWGVAAVIPSDNNGVLGKAVFFDPVTGGILSSVDVGYHPDSLFIDPVGQRVVVTNEAEHYNGSLPGVTQQRGGLSIIDFSSTAFASLTNANVITTELAGPGGLFAGLRTPNPSIGMNTATTAAADVDVEPEYAALAPDGQIYVTLQESNAIVAYNPGTNTFGTPVSLGVHAQRVDASDRDGPGGTAAILVDDTVFGMPQPDAISSYQVGGTTYLVTANEGDSRLDGADEAERVKNLNRAVTDGDDGDVDPTYFDGLDALYGSAHDADALLGRLTVSGLDGDADGDGDIDQYRMYGTRSFSIWDTAGNRVWDSGSFFEDYIAANDAGAWADGRSDNKGPEPEALVLGEVDGRMMAFIGMERTNGIFAFDISDPLMPDFVAYINDQSLGALTSPEGFAFIPASLSPTGFDLLVAGFEVSGTIGVYSVPEPASAIGALALAGLGLAAARRRRA